MSKHFILIHGAWHGGWCWEGVIRALEKAGHTAEAPTMPGHNGLTDDRFKIKLDDYVDEIVAVVEQQTQPVILVGHSSAGFLIQAAAPRVADKIEQLIFLNAFVLPNGMSQFDIIPPGASEGLIVAAQITKDNTIPVIEDFVCRVLMPNEPIKMQQALLRRMVPQPMALFSTPVQTEAFEKLNIPKAVVFCKNDTSLPAGAYLEMAEALGEYQLVEIEGGHEAFFTHPERVTQSFLQVLKSLN